jgi:hypothetical protein
VNCRFFNRQGSTSLPLGRRGVKRRARCPVSQWRSHASRSGACALAGDTLDWDIGIDVIEAMNPSMEIFHWTQPLKLAAPLSIGGDK